MKAKRAQGLPINMIVLLVIAVIVMLLIIGFAGGSLSSLFKSTQAYQNEPSETEINAAQIGCSTSCSQAKALSTTENSWKSSQYCSKTFFNNTKHCWQDPVSIDCEITLKDNVKCCDEGCACSC